MPVPPLLQNNCHRCFRLVAGLDIQVFVDHIQCVHLLTLVLMETFYLYIKNRIFIHCDVFLFLKICCQLFLFPALDLVNIIQDLLVTLIL